MKIELVTVLFWAGVALAVFGLAWIDPRLVLVGLGALLILVSVAAGVVAALRAGGPPR